MNQKKILFAALISISTLASGNIAVTAADSPSDKTAAAPPAATSSAPAPGAPSTKASLVAYEQQLRRMGEAEKRLKRAAMDLIGECTQPLEMAGEIDIIGTDVIPIMPITAEGFGNQYLPPRPKYINLHMQQLGQLMPILQDDINTLNIPPEEKDTVAPFLTEVNSLMADITTRYGKLQKLTAGGDYDQFKITSEAQGIHSALGQMEKSRRKLFKEDKAQEKQTK